MILLTGSTGFVGRHLAPRLKESGYFVRCLVRRNSKAEHLLDTCYDKVIGDVLDEFSLKYAMKGAHTVIHLATARKEAGAVTFEGTSYLGTRHVVEVAKAAGVKRFILFSMIGARPKAASKFHHFKWLAEEYLRHSGLAYAIFRPTIIYGPHDHFVSKWKRKLERWSVVPIIGSGNNLLQPVSVDDIVEAVVRVLKDFKNGSVYEMGGPDRLSFEDILRRLAQFIKQKIRILHIPVFAVRSYAAVYDLVHHNPPFSSDEIIRWMENRICDNTIAEQSLGIKFTSFEDGLLKTVTRV